MADNVGNKPSKEYHLDIPVQTEGFFLKGLNNNDFGLKNRLSRIFQPKSGNAVVLAFDHGYIMGSTAGLERLDVTIAPLAPHVDVFMGTRGAIRSCFSPTMHPAVCLRATRDSSVLYDDMSVGNGCGVEMEDAIRMNASAVAVQTFIGAQGEADSLKTLCSYVDAGNRYGIPVLGVVAVGKEMERTAKFFLLATRILAEHGAHFVKTYYCDDFEKVTAACPVPIIVAGGKKLAEEEALAMTYRAIQEGAHGVDMGRNIFQSEDPTAMAQAIAKVVHEKYTDKQAYEFFMDTKKK